MGPHTLYSGVMRGSAEVVGEEFHDFTRAGSAKAYVEAGDTQALTYQEHNQMLLDTDLGLSFEGTYMSKLQGSV